MAEVQKTGIDKKWRPEMSVAKTEFRPQRSEKRPAPKEREAPRPFFDFAQSVNENRDRVSVDTKLGAATLVFGGRDVSDTALDDYARAVKKSFADRLRKLDVDSKPSISVTREEAIPDREHNASVATMTPFAELESRVFVRAQFEAAIEPSGREVFTAPEAVVVKVIHDEISPESIYAAPLDGETLPELTPLDAKGVNELKKQLKRERGKMTAEQFTKRFVDLRNDPLFRGITPPERLALVMELRREPLGLNDILDNKKDNDDVARVVEELKFLKQQTAPEEFRTALTNFRDGPDYRALSPAARVLIEQRLFNDPRVGLDVKDPQNSELLARFHVTALPEDDELVARFREPDLAPDEHLAVEDYVGMLRDMKAPTPEVATEARQAMYESLPYDRNYQDLSDTAKIVLFDRLRRYGLSPKDERAGRKILQRKKLVAATNAGRNVAILVARGSSAEVRNLTASLRTRTEETPLEVEGKKLTIKTGERTEVVATLYPGDTVAVVSAASAEDAIAAMRVAPDRSPVALSALLAQEGFKTNLVISPLE